MKAKVYHFLGQSTAKSQLSAGIPYGYLQVVATTILEILCEVKLHHHPVNATTARLSIEFRPFFPTNFRF